MTSFINFLRYLDFIRIVSQTWNCGGALALVSPFVVMIGSTILYFLLTRDLFFALGVKLHLRAKKGNIITKPIYKVSLSECE